MVYRDIQNHQSKKRFAVLLDPDKHTEESMRDTARRLSDSPTDYILIGGSLVSGYLTHSIEIIKSECKLPVILFPGSLLQISPNADAILLLSLISGRNPELLIGNHVVAAPFLKNSGLEIIPTAYILIESGHVSSVEYMSNTKPLPADKPDIAVATALAGEMLGMKMIYLEAGSGASRCVPAEIIKKVKENIASPLIVGGGIRSYQDACDAYEAGADIIVVGNAFENHPAKIQEISLAALKY